MVNEKGQGVVVAGKGRVRNYTARIQRGFTVFLVVARQLLRRWRWDGPEKFRSPGPTKAPALNARGGATPGSTQLPFRLDINGPKT